MIGTGDVAEETIA